MNLSELQHIKKILKADVFPIPCISTIQRDESHIKICNEINLDPQVLMLLRIGYPRKDCMCEIIDAFCQLCEL